MRTKTTTYKKDKQRIKVFIKPFKTGYKYKIKEHKSYNHFNSIKTARIINRLENRGFKTLW